MKKKKEKIKSKIKNERENKCKKKEKRLFQWTPPGNTNTECFLYNKLKVLGKGELLFLYIAVLKSPLLEH